MSYNPNQATPVVIFFHGAGDTAANFFNTLKGTGWLTAAEIQGAIVVVPDTKSPRRSFANWSGNPSNDRAQIQQEFSDIIELVAKDIWTRYNVNIKSNHVAGFSDGGLFIEAAAFEQLELATLNIFGYGAGAFYPFNVIPPEKRPVQMACGTMDGFFRGADQTQNFLKSQGHEVNWQPINGVSHSFSGISLAISPDVALGWMLARQHP
jgi:poly(3-hydroxybutyrate) depolymerase